MFINDLPILWIFIDSLQNLSTCDYYNNCQFHEWQFKNNVGIQKEHDYSEQHGDHWT